MASIHRQFIREPQSRAASQLKQLPVSPYGSLCGSQRELHQCQDVAECLEVWRLWMGGHWKLQNGVIPDGSSRRFHEISLFPLPLGQPWHYSALSQKGVAITEPFWVIFDVFLYICCHMFLNHFYCLIKKISSINNHNIIFFFSQLEDDILSVILCQFHFQMVKQKVYSLPESLFNT